MKHILPEHWREGHLHVDLVGVGGTGSQVLTGLARLHLAIRALGGYGLKVRAFDPDTVSEANIGRQLFAPSDVGLHKCNVLVNRLNMYFGLDWEAFPLRYGAETQAQSRLAGESMIGDLIVTCVDSAHARRDVWAFLNRRSGGAYRETYWLDCGNARQSGQVFLSQLQRSLELTGRSKARSLPPLPHWLPEIFDESIPEDDAPSCSLAEALENQDLFINQAIATWALHLLWSFIREGGLDVCGYWISLESGMVAPVAIPEAPVKGKGRKAGTNG